MTTDQVLVNGALMDQSYFAENLVEAKSLPWTRFHGDTSSEHRHCLVCTKPISLLPLEECYRSGHRYLCAYCRSHYVAPPAIPEGHRAEVKS